MSAVALHLNPQILLPCFPQSPFNTLVSVRLTQSYFNEQPDVFDSPAICSAAVAIHTGNGGRPVSRCTQIADLTRVGRLPTVESQTEPLQNGVKSRTVCAAPPPALLTIALLSTVTKILWPDRALLPF
jgi:hypothetical protein